MEIFGTSDQQRMLRKGENLLALLANDPCFCSHWRAVLLSDYTAGQATVEILIHLTRLQGVSGCEMVPDAAAPGLMQALIERNLKVDSYVNFIGGKESIEIARATLAKGGLAPDLSLQIIDETSPPSLLEAFAEVALAEEVLPSAGSVMRGIARPGFGTVAFDTDARPVATAAGALSRHRGHPDHDMAQWGQLETWNDRKG